MRMYSGAVARSKSGWHVVVKLDGKEIYRSERAFHNRDQDTTFRTAARPIADSVARHLNHQSYAVAAYDARTYGGKYVAILTYIDHIRGSHETQPQ